MIAVMNMANRCHDCGVSSHGMGRFQITIPKIRVMILLVQRDLLWSVDPCTSGFLDSVQDSKLCPQYFHYTHFLPGWTKWDFPIFRHQL
jgi:hypothetical protein